MTTTQPKPTLKALDERQQEMSTTLVQIEEKLGTLNKATTEAMRLGKGQGRVNTRLYSKVGALQRSYETLLTRIEAANGQMTPAMKADATNLLTRVADTEVQLSALQKQVEEHETTLGNHTTQIDMLEDGQTSLNNRVSILERVAGFPKKRFIMALIIAVVVAFIWGFHRFGQTVVYPDGSEFWVDYTFANSWLGAFLAGFVTFVLIFGLSLFYTGKSKKDSKKNEERQPAPATELAEPAPIRTPVAQRSGSDDQAPTKVHATSGAPSGTH